jgi:Holliday junction resolvase-like predicted endonuclease
MQVAEQKNRELSDVKARFLERQTQANNYKRRVDVIDSLRASQSRPGEPAGHAGRDGERNRSGLAEEHG